MAVRGDAALRSRHVTSDPTFADQAACGVKVGSPFHPVGSEVGAQPQATGKLACPAVTCGVTSGSEPAPAAVRDTRW